MEKIKYKIKFSFKEDYYAPLLVFLTLNAVETGNYNLNDFLRGKPEVYYLDKEHKQVARIMCPGLFRKRKVELTDKVSTDTINAIKELIAFNK